MIPKRNVLGCNASGRPVRTRAEPYRPNFQAVRCAGAGVPGVLSVSL